MLAGALAPKILGAVGVLLAAEMLLVIISSPSLSPEIISVAVSFEMPVSTGILTETGVFCSTYLLPAWDFMALFGTIKTLSFVSVTIAAVTLIPDFTLSSWVSKLIFTM